MALLNKTQLRKMEAMGVIAIENKSRQMIEAHWPERNWRFEFDHGKEAVARMGAILAYAKENPDLDQAAVADRFGVKVLGDGLREVVDNAQSAPPNAPAESVMRSEDDTPLDGGAAFDEGMTEDANPFTPDTAEWTKWAIEWHQRDNEANKPAQEDAHQASDGELGDAEGEAGDRSVVKSKYRAKYAELGHPKHCGDWLAVLLNNLCGGKEHADIELFEAICNMNGVNLEKYNRTSQGWQGRLRMTGRNMLAKVVWQQGELKVPLNVNAEGHFKAPDDWMVSQRFMKAAVDKNKAQAQPTAQGSVAGQ